MAPRKRKRLNRTHSRRHKSAQNGSKRTEITGFDSRQPYFRLTALQPISLALEALKPFELSIQGIRCRLMLQPAHADAVAQRTHGGTLVSVDFSLPNANDLLRATKKGLDLVDDFFSALSLVQGGFCREVEPIEIISADPAASGNYPFLHFRAISVYYWPTPISHYTMDAIRGLLAHWDGLDSGKRLRRAARQFHKAIGSEDSVAAFQQAYMGLEAIEKPLAQGLGIPPGLEEIQGKCENCGAAYTRRKTLLVGVRGLICGNFHHKAETPERRKEWQEINDLRQKLFHSLDDTSQLEKDVHGVLPAAMHYLHDGICCLSHAHNLESPDFKLFRGTRWIVLAGSFKHGALDPLEQSRPLLNTDEVYWVSHPQYGFVPQCRVTNLGKADLKGTWYWLNAPLETASEETLLPANLEWKQCPSDPSDE